MSSVLCLTMEDYRKESINRLPKMVRDYYEAGADTESSLRRNETAYKKLLIIPRCLRDVSHIDTQTQWLDTIIKIPIGVAPTAFQKMAHPQGELATIRGASQAGALMILSSWSTTAVGEVTNEAARYGGIVWFQLYVYKDREITRYLIQQAERAGVKALVLTVDTPVLGRRLADLRNEFKLPDHLRFANLPPHEPEKRQMDEVEEGHSGLIDYVKEQIDPSLSWETLQWIRSVTSIPIVVKGVMRAEDAKLAVESGASAIIVSNHGGRQMDCTPATVEILPSIVKCVGERIPVFVDGGIRSGQDALKAVALGARGVFVGRPILWALSVEGSEGVKRALNIMQHEFTEGMRLAGYRSIKELQSDKQLLIHESRVHKL